MPLPAEGPALSRLLELAVDSPRFTQGGGRGEFPLTAYLLPNVVAGVGEVEAVQFSVRPLCIGRQLVVNLHRRGVAGHLRAQDLVGRAGDFGDRGEQPAKVRDEVCVGDASPGDDRFEILGDPGTHHRVDRVGVPLHKRTIHRRVGGLGDGIHVFGVGDAGQGGKTNKECGKLHAFSLSPGVRGFSGILKLIARQVCAAREPNLVALVALGEHFARGWKVAHRVAGAPKFAGVGFRAVDDAPFVKGALVGFEFEVNRPVRIDRCNLDREDVGGGVNRLVLAKAVGVGPGDHRHRSVRGVGAVHREPNRANSGHRGNPSVPVRGVFVPGRRLSNFGRLGDEVAAPEADIRPDYRLDEVEHRIAEQELQQAGVFEVDHVEALLAVGGEVFFKNGLQSVELGLGEDGAVVKNVAVLGVLGDLLGSEWHALSLRAFPVGIPR